MIAKDRLIFPLDVPDAQEARRYVNLLSGPVGVFKIGLEFFVAQGPSMIDNIAHLTDAATFLDLKFHDIPVTVHRAIRSTSTMKRASFVTVHCDPSLMEAVLDDVPDSTKGC